MTEEAQHLAHSAVETAQDVAETAKDEVANIAAEVQINARELIAQAMSDLSEQAATQQQRIAEGLRSVSQELHAMVSTSREPGLATDLVRQAAERSATVASWLNDRDPGSLLAEAKSFARHKPGTFLLLAAGAGIVVGRISRSLSAGSPDPVVAAKHAAETSPVKSTASDPAKAAAPSSVESREAPGSTPGPSTAQLPTSSAPFGETGTFPGDQNGAEAQIGTDKPELWRAEPVVVEPLPAPDPFDEDPFDGRRR